MDKQIKFRLIQAIFRTESEHFRKLANTLSAELYALTGEVAVRSNGHIQFLKVA